MCYFCTKNNMEKNQFVHKLVMQKSATEFEISEETGSFNVNNVNRTAEYQKGCIVVILNDGHEHTFEQPVYSNTGKPKNVQRVKQWVTSEIFLTEEDTVNYRKLTSIN